MAAASVQLSPRMPVGGMASNRRTPLSALPNAGNSPFRGNAARDVINGLKRTRPTGGVDTEARDVQQPPAKKHIADSVEGNGPVTPRKTRATTAENTPPAARKHAARVREPSRAVAAANAAAAKQESHGESMEKLRVWQRHNEKTFPTYVFYFDSVPDAIRRENTKDLKQLGAREAQFFSRDVTHVITTRIAPSDNHRATAYTESTAALAQPEQDKARPHTVNPSLLDKPSSSNAMASTSRGKFAFEAPLTRKMLAPTNDAENRRPQPVDMLQKAKDLGIKIWSVEKLQRILDVMFDVPINNPPKPKAKGLTAVPKGQAQHQDLQALIRNEEAHGPNEQEVTKLLGDIIPFKGPCIYIRCVNEKVKPIMVRQWPSVESKEDGDWPQFRSVSPGRCPFVPEEARARKHDEETKVILERKARAEANEQVRKVWGAQREERKGAKQPVVNEATAPTAAAKKKSGSESLPQHTAVRGQEFKSPYAQRLVSQTRPGMTGAEPMASGLQASNVTSAIRSQMISSTAAAPGVKAGTSREIHGLQRKLLERGTGSLQQPNSALTRSQAMIKLADSGAAQRTSSRVAKQEAQAVPGQPRLSNVREDGDFEEEETTTSRPSTATVEKQKPMPVKPVKKEPKPGYCENCREKFEDFEEHTVSKRHHKFAVTRENWKELDGLLAVLGRPLLHDSSKS